MSRVQFSSTVRTHADAVGVERPQDASLLEIPTKLVSPAGGVDGGYKRVIRCVCPNRQDGLPYGPRSRPATRAGIRALPIWSAVKLERLFRTAAPATGNACRGSDTPGAGCGHQSLVLRSVWRSPMGSLVVRFHASTSGMVAP